MTQLRDRMLEELERRNYAPGTARAYLFAVKQLLRQPGERQVLQHAMPLERLDEEEP
jgi:hypothetical protein